jgi:outer membrane protein OmpA-like peptidoglycan-associated protein
MSFRNWLLTGTSLTLLAFAPLSVARAQDITDPALVAAYEAYQADQSEANKTALTEACITAGFATLDECIAALTGQTAVESTPPESSAEAPASSEAPVAEPASSEAPVASEPVSSEAPVEQPASSEPVAESPASSEAPVEQPASSEAPVTEQSSAEQPASSEVAAPVSSEAPASSEAPTAETNDAVAQLTAAVELYNQGVAELTAGDANGQVKIDDATAQMKALCEPAGYPDIPTCVAQFGLTLNPLPPVAEPPATSSEQPATSSEQPATSEEPVTDQATEVLPETVPPEEAAPILDSQKDETAPADTTTSEQPPAEQPSQEPPAPTEPVAPPADDKAAQEDVQPPPPEQQSAATGEGQADGNFQFGFADSNEPDGGFAIPAEDDGEKVEVVQAPSADNPNFVFKIGIHIYITNVQRERDRFYDRDRDQIFYERLDNGRIRETIQRPDGTRIITVYNRYGDVLKRTKIYPDNREFYLATYDPTDEDDSFFLDPGDDLPPLRLSISAGDYILDADEADEAEVEFFLSQPPVEKIHRIYSVSEVKRSARIRDTVRRLEIGNLTFDTGKATISRDQVSELSKVANAILKLLEANPAEVFLIEGHTDAVGSDLSNLELSDERASTVARILTDFYEVPPENLTTQGYGERYLKVKTEDAEELNRRVTFKRITPLVTYETASN